MTGDGAACRRVDVELRCRPSGLDHTCDPVELDGGYAAETDAVDDYVLVVPAHRRRDARHGECDGEGRRRRSGRPMRGRRVDGDRTRRGAWRHDDLERSGGDASGRSEDAAAEVDLVTAGEAAAEDRDRRSDRA